MGSSSRIGVFSQNGDLIRPIKIDLPPVTVPSEYAETLIHSWKTDPLKSQYFPYLKPFSVAEHFPALRQFRTSDGKLHVITYHRRGDLSRCLVFTQEGKREGDHWIPLVENDPMEFFPFTIHKGKLSQLVNTDEWVLRISDIF